MKLAMFCAALALVLIPLTAKGQPVSLNIISAIDASDSIEPIEEALELEGLARGVTDERFLQRVAETDAGAVGFLAFLWSSNGKFNVIIPWMVIRGPEDAEEAAALFRSSYRERNQYGYPSGSLTYGRPASAQGMTDTNGAMMHALILAASAPFPAPRTVINILTDSKHNEGQHPSKARRVAVERGVTINVIYFNYSPPPGDDEPIEEYFRQHVATGPGSFVEPAGGPLDMPEVMARKFLQDMVAAQ